MSRTVKTSRLGPFPHVNIPVFTVSAGLILVFILFGALFPDFANTVFQRAQSWIADKFGWLLILTTNACLILTLALAFSRYGHIRLGHQTEQPEYSLVAWTAMLFSAGIGIGLLYWAVAEPLFHFFSPPVGEAENVEAAQQAMVLAFLHWGWHGWGIYCMVALALAYFHFRQGLPLSIRSALYPILGERIYGPIGHAVDILAVFGTMFGVVTSLGLGVMQIGAGMDEVFGVPDTIVLQLVLIAAITACATISVMLGLDGGIKRISSFNIYLSFALLAFILAVGPTLYIFDSFIENVGNYVENLVRWSSWAESYSGTDWQVDWTIFYWAWWISWSPFVGIFIARISRGRTVREFLLGVLFIPTTILFFWFTAFGGVALKMELAGDPGLIAATQEGYGNAIFRLIDFFPLTGLVGVVIIVMIVVWFVTSSDSASFVIDMLTAGGNADPPKIQRMFWAISEGCIAAILLVAGGLKALQAAAVVAGLPFTFVLIAMIYSLFRGIGRDPLVLHRAEQWYRTEEEADINTPDAYPGESDQAGPPALSRTT